MDRGAWWVTVRGVLKKVRHDLVTKQGDISSLCFSKQTPISEQMRLWSSLLLQQLRAGNRKTQLTFELALDPLLALGSSGVEEERFRENSKSLFPGWVCHFFSLVAAASELPRTGHQTLQVIDTFKNWPSAGFMSKIFQRSYWGLPATQFADV